MSPFPWHQKILPLISTLLCFKCWCFILLRKNIKKPMTESDLFFAFLSVISREHRGRTNHWKIIFKYPPFAVRLFFKNNYLLFFCRVNSFNQCLSILHKFVDLYQDVPASFEIFAPVKEHLQRWVFFLSGTNILHTYKEDYYKISVLLY